VVILEEFIREEALIGKENIKKLKRIKVAIFGIGGVGSYALEILARSGVSNFILVDFDVVSISNINRQLIATLDTVGKYKVDVAKDRVLSINKNAKVKVIKDKFSSVKDYILDNDTDYIVDAIDDIKAKIDLIKLANEKNIKIISSMSTGNKLDPLKFKVSDIYKTKMCPIAKILRKELKSIGIKKLKVVYSEEESIKTSTLDEYGKHVPSSIAFVPSVCGIVIASEVIKDTIKQI